MIRWLRSPDLASVILRLALAAVFISHGAMKIPYEGGTAWYLEGGRPIEPVMQALVAWGELLCGVALLLGLLTRLAAAGLIAIMIGAVYMVTWRLDFTIPPDAARHGSTVGYEYNYTIMAMCLALVIQGAGALALDRLLFGPRQVPTAPPRTTSEAPVAVRT